MADRRKLASLQAPGSRHHVITVSAGASQDGPQELGSFPNEQRETSWGVLTSLKTETKSVASRLGKAGQRAGGLAVHHALKKIHFALKSKEQARKEEPEKQCRSEPITRVASRPGSPDRHTISSSPSDKEDFFQVRRGGWLQLSAPQFVLLRCTFKRH